MFDTPMAAMVAIRKYYILNETSLPIKLKTALEPYINEVGPPIGLIPTFTEGVYAYRDVMDQEAKDIAEACSYYTYWSLGQDSRGLLIGSVLRGEPVENPPSPQDTFTEEEV